jgi:aconitate hydratase
MNDAFQTLHTFDLGSGKKGKFFSLPALEKSGVGPISRLPVSIRIVLESVLRNCDGKRVEKTMCGRWPTGARKPRLGRNSLRVRA